MTDKEQRAHDITVSILPNVIKENNWRYHTMDKSGTLINFPSMHLYLGTNWLNLFVKRRLLNLICCQVEKFNCFYCGQFFGF